MTIAQEHQIKDLQCATPIYDITCKVDEDCMPSCKDKYKDRFMSAGCILSPDKSDRICLCGYYC